MRRRFTIYLATATLAWLAAAMPVSAADPGTGSAESGPRVSVAGNSLNEFKTIVGQVVLSEDACGTNGPSCTVDIEKPTPAATVFEADLFCATTGFSGYSPADGDVTVNGSPVAWDEIIPNAIASFNARDDVTATVKPVADAALPGVVTFTITEDPTTLYDGCALKVIWDDPTTTTNSILIFWGAQETEGDTFVITFAPLDPSAFLEPLEFSLGISFGAQGPCAPTGTQFSQVDVNGARLTTSAGGEDDGVCQNGALITLGGTGDTPANPPAFAPPTANPSVPDDELYDLRPFVNPGDTSMTIFTLNPSNDDNIFLANLFLQNVVVVPPEPVPTTLTLDPKADVNPVDTEHCVTATVRDQFGDPMPGVTVVFDVEGASEADTVPADEDGSVATDANGEATFCYTGPDFPGEDAIHAFADSDNDGLQDPGEPFDDATKTWVLPATTPGCEVKITNGGWIIAMNGDRASFGGNAKADADGNVSGQEEYQDHGPAQPMNLHGNVLVVVCESETSATIFGTATVDGAGSFLYRLRVEDNGEPGKGTDRYWITVANGYDSGNQVLKGGNVQIHLDS